MSDFELILLSIVLVVSALNIYTILQLRKSEKGGPYLRPKKVKQEKVDEEKKEESKVIELE